jgi:hypothetical protein
VQAIFQGEGCPATTGIRPDIGDCWFVTFNSEEDALKALDFVRGRTFQDAPVKARIKSENLLRSLYVHNARSATPAREASASSPAHTFSLSSTTYYPPAAAGDLGMKMGGQYTGYNYYPQYAGQQGTTEISF